MHDSESGTLPQRTSEKSTLHQSQPDHLDAAENKPTIKKAWQTPATVVVENHEPQSNGVVEDVNVKQVKEDLKVEDVEDEQQEIMEYVAVLEEEEEERY